MDIETRRTVGGIRARDCTRWRLGFLVNSLTNGVVKGRPSDSTLFLIYSLKWGWYFLGSLFIKVSIYELSQSPQIHFRWTLASSCLLSFESPTNPLSLCGMSKPLFDVPFGTPNIRSPVVVLVIQFWSPLSPTIETEHIYIYINPENMSWSPDREWTNMSPFCFCFKQDMDLLRLWRAPPLSKFSQKMGAKEERVCSYSKTDVIKMNRHTLWIYTLLP